MWKIFWSGGGAGNETGADLRTVFVSSLVVFVCFVVKFSRTHTKNGAWRTFLCAVPSLSPIRGLRPPAKPTAHRGFASAKPHGTRGSSGRVRTQDATPHAQGGKAARRQDSKAGAPPLPSSAIGTSITRALLPPTFPPGKANRGAAVPGAKTRGGGLCAAGCRVADRRESEVA